MPVRARSTSIIALPWKREGHEDARLSAEEKARGSDLRHSDHGGIAVSEKDGGPAFPNTVYGYEGVGMTLRDYFAAKAMQAAMTNHQAWDAKNETQTARVAYIIADAMLKARLK